MKIFNFSFVSNCSPFYVPFITNNQRGLELVTTPFHTYVEKLFLYWPITWLFLMLQCKNVFTVYVVPKIRFRNLCQPYHDVIIIAFEILGQGKSLLKFEYLKNQKNFLDEMNGTFTGLSLFCRHVIKFAHICCEIFITWIWCWFSSLLTVAVTRAN